MTRALVLELSAERGHPVRGGLPPPRRARRGSDEAFLTSTTREVQAVGSVDGRALPAAPGPLTTRLDAAFRGLVARDLDP